MKICLAGLAMAGALAAQPAGVAYRIETVAGSNQVGDGGPALTAALSDAEGVTVDQTGNIYVADANDHRVRKITPDGRISTVDGNGTAGAQGALLNNPYGVAVDGAGNLYIADLGNNRIRRVTTSGTIDTIAPDAPGGWLTPRNIALDTAGNLYVAEFAGHRIRRIGTDGTVSIFAGTGIAGFGGDGGPPRSAQFAYPAGLCFDALGNLYVADSGNHRVREITPYGLVTTVLGTGIPGADDPAQLSLPTGVAIDATGSLYIADSGNQRIRALAPSGQIRTVPGAGRDVAFDSAGNLYIASGTRLLEVNAAGVVMTAAGNSSPLFRGDGGQAASSLLNGPVAVAVSAAGELYIADSGNQRVRKVDAGGTITTVAGDGTPGLSDTQLSFPSGLAVDISGNLYIADQNNDRVQKLSADGLLITAAGTGMPGFSGDGLPAASAELNSPAAVAFGGDGTLFIGDIGNQRVRGILPTGVITTIAAPVQARAIAADSFGTVYVADSANHRILAISPAGSIRTIAGTGVPGFSGDGAHAIDAQLNQPRGLALDSSGNLFVADSGNHRVRQVSADGLMQTVAGTGVAALTGDGGPALDASLNSPYGVTVDSGGAIWIADTGNNRVRKLSPAVASVQQPSVAGVVNAASFILGPVAPGEIVSIFGAGLGPAAAASGIPDGSGTLATQLAGVQVLFDGQPAPLLYVQESQINAQVPNSVAGQVSTQMEVMYQGASAGKATLGIASAVPGIFTVDSGTGQAAAIEGDGSINSASNPAPRGSVVTLFATGVGQADAGPLSLTIGAYPAEILYSSEVPGFAGVLQISARLPAGFAPGGVLNVVLQVGQAASQPGVTIAAQ